MIARGGTRCIGVTSVNESGFSLFVMVAAGT
jgi:hypothetical protein